MTMSPQVFADLVDRGTASEVPALFDVEPDMRQPNLKGAFKGGSGGPARSARSSLTGSAQTTEAVTDLRTLKNARLDALQHALWDAAMTWDVRP